MNLNDAIKGMLDARKELRSSQGVNNPSFMSKHMDRLAQYTGAVEEHLAELEAEYEDRRYSKYLELSKTQSVTKAENDSKAMYAKEAGDIKKLTRLVKSSWAIVSEKQSRINHFEKNIAGQEG